MMFNRTELVMPPAITLEMVKGFHALHGEGGDERPGDEVIDLARSNLWR
jgi:pyruvate dehydrogenase (quinone)